MLNIQSTYNLNQSAGSMPVVFHASEVKESKAPKFIASLLLMLSVGSVSLQSGFVLNAFAEGGNPITSAISAPEAPTAPVCPAGHVSKVVNGVTVCVAQGQSQSQEQTNNPTTSPEVSPTPTPAPVSSPEVTTNQPSGSNPSNGGNNGSSNNNSGGGSNSAPSCETQAPKAPKIVSAVTTGKNEITLNWEKPISGNVTHYSVAYGLLKGKPLYGVANVGNVNSFKVSGLGGGVTYYFTVKAVNDCTPSVASNEVAMKVGGKFINTPAVGFKAGVLGQTNAVKANTNKNTNNKPALAKPVFFNNVNTPVNAGFAGKVVSFFKGLF